MVEHSGRLAIEREDAEPLVLAAIGIVETKVVERAPVRTEAP